MRAVATGGQAREILIALPSGEVDQYRVHQDVWRHVVEVCGPTREPPVFIYRIDGPMIRVRSCAFGRQGIAATFRADKPVYLDLAALHGGGNKQPVPPHMLADWCRRQLAATGFDVRSLDVLAYESRTGFKAAGAHKISIPVAQLRAELRASDPASAERAWRNGIGRGKRFGLGMLAH